MSHARPTRYASTAPARSEGTGSRRRCRGAGGGGLGMALARFPGGSAKEPSRDQCFARSRTQSRCRVHMRNPKADGPYDALERDTRTRTRTRARTRLRMRVRSRSDSTRAAPPVGVVVTRCEPSVARNTEDLLVQVSCSCATLHPAWSPERQQRRRSRGGEDVELQRRRKTRNCCQLEELPHVALVLEQAT